MINEYASSPKKTQEIITGFSGWNKKSRIRENEFSEEKNISSDDFPSVSPRNKRGIFNVPGNNIHSLFPKKELCFIKDGTLYVGNTEVTGLLFPDLQVKRQLVSLGAKLLVFPDKVYVNTENLSDYGSLEAEFSSNGSTVTFSLCMGDGTLYSGYTVSSVAPSEPQDGDLWLCTSVTPNVLKVYSSALTMWVETAETYVKISCPNIGSQFEKYDGINISGAAEASLNGTFAVQDKGNDYIVITGIITNTVTQSTDLSVTRALPDMDFVCENGNRIWGCNSLKNEIYASKLGDPKNFNCFMGISTDSYAVSVGTDGAFTGAVSFRGYVLFFKENCLHKIYGSNPPFTVTSSYLRGVQKGSEQSLKILNETLYYLSPNGVCSFDGGVPLCISESFNKAYYKNGIAGVSGNKYYLCVTDKTGVKTLLVFDEATGVWHKEDNINISEFAFHNFNLYFLAENNNSTELYLADGENAYGNFASVLGGFRLENDVPWVLESGLWGLGLPGNKYYSEICLRGKGESGSSFKVYFQYDDSGTFEEVLSESFVNTKSFCIPVATPRCDTLKIKITGSGKVTLYSISRTVERGSSLNV